MDGQTAKFEGWCLIELFGHQKECGYVTTQYFGDKAMFQVDVPEFPEREYAIQAPQYIDGRLCPAGTVVKKLAIPARSRLVNPGAVYAMNPCTEEAARTAIERSERRELIPVSLPPEKQLAEPDEEEEEDGEEYEDERVDGIEDRL